MLMEWHWWIHVTLTLAALMSWTLVLTMGFSASDRWPHYGMIGNLERSIIFFTGSFITRTAVTNHETRIQILCWMVSAIIFELARQWMSGHSNRIVGWLASMAGTVVGAVPARYIAHAYQARHASI